MKIFMDTANVDEIKEFADQGIVYGVTTNPSLVARSGRTQADVIPEICRLVPGPVSAEVISQDCEGMVREARELVKIAANVVVKIPCITEGLKAIKILSAEGIRTNCTLIFSLAQAMLAARAGRYRGRWLQTGGRHGEGVPHLQPAHADHRRQHPQPCPCGPRHARRGGHRHDPDEGPEGTRPPRADRQGSGQIYGRLSEQPAEITFCPGKKTTKEPVA